MLLLVFVFRLLAEFEFIVDALFSAFNSSLMLVLA